MSEVDERLINVKINSEVKKYETLKKAFLKLYESESKASKARKENLNKLNNRIENDNQNIDDIYTSFIDKMKNIEKDRETHLEKIMDLILPVINIYPERLKNSKKDLENLSKIRKNISKLEKSRNEVKNGNVDQVQSINKSLAKSRNEERNKEENIETGISKFEEQRIEDNKLLFLQYIHSELKYHAAALQKMSELFNDINEKEPFEDLEKFAEEYNINVDFQRDLKIDMEEIKRKKEEREEKENKNAKNVYESKNNNEEDIKKSVAGGGLGVKYQEDSN